MGASCCSARKELELGDEKKKNEVTQFLRISTAMAGGAPQEHELNFLPLLSGATGVSDDEKCQVWGNVIGPGKACAKAPCSMSQFSGTVLFGFLPYKGPTEKARMLMAFKKDQWLDCRIWASWRDFKQVNAGAAGLPTGVGPMIWDENLKTPSGACHRISEWVAVDYYVAAKHSMMGETAEELASILLLRELCEWSGDLESFAFIEAALRVSTNPSLCLGKSATLADIILFNSLSHSYGLQSFRDEFGHVFRLCFPHLTKFYHAMLTQATDLREYMFSSVHTPAIYFLPWTLQQPGSYQYVAEDNCATPPSEDDLVAASLPADQKEKCSEILEKVRVHELSFPLVRDAQVKSDFSVLYLHEALAEQNAVQNDLLWEFLRRVCDDMGVKSIERHSGVSAPTDGPLLWWDRTRHEMFIPAVYVAALKGKFPLSNAPEGAKILQVVSMVRQLIKSWMHDVESFEKDCCDKSRAGAIFSNISPGNVQFLEALLCLNEWKRGSPIIGEAKTLADIYTFRFLELVDERLLKEGVGLMSWESWRDSFPLVSQFYEAAKTEAKP